VDRRVVNAADARAIAAHFGVRTSDEVELGGGFSNASWCVRDAGGARYVARRYGRLHVTRRAVFYEHAVMRHAAARAASVRAPLTDSAGETILASPDGFAALLPYVEGTTGARDAAASSRAAVALARFHLAMRDFHAARPRVARTLGTLPWLRHRVLDFAADPLLARALPWDDVLTSLAAATTRFAPLASLLPLAVVHGDMHPANIVSEPDGGATPIDFDFAHETERAYDLATAVDEFGRADDDAPLDLARGLGFVRAYEAQAPLSEPEWAALPSLAVRRNATLAWYVVTRHGLRARGDVGNAARYVRRACEWRALLGTWEAHRAAS
jgi:Ser/Thr protein kinase RdoA (MazF antagonist)